MTEPILHTRNGVTYEIRLEPVEVNARLAVVIRKLWPAYLRSRNGRGTHTGGTNETSSPATDHCPGVPRC